MKMLNKFWIKILMFLFFLRPNESIRMINDSRIQVNRNLDSIFDQKQEEIETEEPKRRIKTPLGTISIKPVDVSIDARDAVNAVKETAKWSKEKLDKKKKIQKVKDEYIEYGNYENREYDEKLARSIIKELEESEKELDYF